MTQDNVVNELLTKCYVTTRDGKERVVKNLGYLLKRWQEVERIQLWTELCGQRVKLPGSVFEGCLLVVHFRNGDTYSCPWADCEHCVSWLHRPVFYGLKFREDNGPEREIKRA